MDDHAPYAPAPTDGHPNALPVAGPSDAGPVTGGRRRPVALITGGSSGIGAATALRLARAGWLPVVSGTDRARLAAVAAGCGGHALPADLAGPGGAQHLAERALAVAGRVDALVASAGVGWRGPFAEMPPQVLDEMVEVDLAAPLRLSRLLLPGMLERRRGHIVLLGSMAGQVGVGDEAAYAAAKGGLSLFAESLWYELRGTGVGVGIILPGAVDTPFFARRGTPFHRERPRPVPPERIADAILSMISGRRDRYFAPGWLAMPARLHGVAPGLFRQLAARFG
ncbi:SDR family NAD(P)-dependent oxidoreductase [Kitasatospora sp. NPDC094015]|uniref:SDR family NAD(P)-dependent oxidoreductase n=1 Tax=Kitasatospora sp. NPDC094015 TaxID=3155205 RepID=UPI003324B477